MKSNISQGEYIWKANSYLAKRAWIFNKFNLLINFTFFVLGFEEFKLRRIIWIQKFRIKNLVAKYWYCWRFSDHSYIRFFAVLVIVRNSRQESYIENKFDSKLYTRNCINCLTQTSNTNTCSEAWRKRSVLSEHRYSYMQFSVVDVTPQLLKRCERKLVDKLLGFVKNSSERTTQI